MTTSPGRPTNILLCGVGGQGVLLASEVLALAATKCSKEVKQTEVHGVAQRGGSVVSHVRYGETIYSPVIKSGEADFVLAFEQLEGLRHAHYIKPDGLVIINHEVVVPGEIGEPVPYPEGIPQLVRRRGIKVLAVDATAVAVGVGHKRVTSMVLLGVLSRYLDIPMEVWEKTLDSRIPARLLEINRRAFVEGRKLVDGNETLVSTA